MKQRIICILALLIHTACSIAIANERPPNVSFIISDDLGSWELEINPAGVDRLAEEDRIFLLTPGQFGGTVSWFASPKTDREHSHDMMAEDAAWGLERCAKQPEKPFFFAVGFFRPQSCFSAFGETAEIKQGMWAPNLTEP